jgi:pimeloyl-ACP methyl ester carboxylesterase
VKVTPDPRNRPSTSERAILFVLRLAVGLCAASLIAFDTVAWAMALSPNAATPEPAPPSAVPDTLLGRPLARRSIDVGPPAATLDAWVLEPATQARATIVLLHGIRMDRRSLSHVGAYLVDAGYRVVLLDLRGHGGSSGRFLTYGEVEARDVSQALDAMQRHAGSGEPFGVFGFSYGAAVALETAARDPRVRAVVAVAPFSSLREVVADYRTRYFPVPAFLVPTAWFQSALDDAGRIAAFDPDQAGPAHSISRVAADILLLHGDRDSQVPPRHSESLWRIAGGRAELELVPGRTHDDVLADRRVRERTLAWFAQRL